MRGENPEEEFSDVTKFLEFMFAPLEIDEPVSPDATLNLGARVAKGTGPRREERRAACRDFLIKWRKDCWLRNHGDEVWGPEILLSDKVVTKLAATASLQTTEDIRDEVEGWWFWERYAQEVLDGLKAIDTRFEAIKAAKEAGRLEQQRIERERREAIASAERQRALEEKDRKRLLKEEADRLKEDAKRLKAEVQRQKAEAKRLKAEVKRQKAEAKRQKEELKQQKEGLEQEREELKRQHEAQHQTEGVDSEAERQREEKRRRTDYTSFIPISSTALPLVQPNLAIRPRPRPTMHLPPIGNGENLNPTSESIASHPFLPPFPSYLASPVPTDTISQGGSTGGIERAGPKPPQLQATTNLV